MKKCLYCGKELDENNVVDFCDKCGINVFGVKMFKAILKNMNNAREKGDLNQGIISQPGKYSSEKEKVSSENMPDFKGKSL